FPTTLSPVPQSPAVPHRTAGTSAGCGVCLCTASTASAPAGLSNPVDTRTCWARPRKSFVPPLQLLEPVVLGLPGKVKDSRPAVAVLFQVQLALRRHVPCEV